jgi:hypothetical protein
VLDACDRNEPMLGFLGNIFAHLLEQHDRMHRGGLGESPDGLRAYRRNRWILSIVSLIVLLLMLFLTR